MKKLNRLMWFPYRLSICRLALVAAGIAWLVAGTLGTFATTDLAATSLSVEGLPLGDDYPYQSPLAAAMSANGDVVYVIYHTGQKVEAVDVGTGAVSWSVSLGAAPNGITLDQERNRLFVTYGMEVGNIGVIDADNGEVLFTMPAGHTPTAPVVSSAGCTLYVGNRFDNEVVVYDLVSRAVRSRTPVVREPIAAALTPDDAMLVVANHLPAQPSNSRHVAALVELINSATLEIEATILLPSGSTGVREVCISPDGQYAYVTHTLGRFHLPTTQLERGWMNTSALTIIDLNSKSWLTTTLLDDVDMGAANPWGVACTADGKTLVVAHSGTHDLSIIDREALHNKINRIAQGERVSEVSVNLNAIPNDLGFLVGLRKRIALPGNSPRGVVVAGDTVVVTEYFSDSLAVMNVGSDTAPAVTQLALGETTELSMARKGEIAFFDADLCFQKWQSCASCHPDVRADALNWDLLNDGIGNPKNNRSLLYTHYTPPVMISGIRASAEVAVRAGFRFIQFAVVSDEVAEAVDEFLATLQPLPSPHLENGKLSPAAVRGKVIFDKAGCMYCHSGPYYTDGKMHDIGTGPDELGIREFVTPMLNEVWRTAPYLYDGRAATIMDVLTKNNSGDKHGKTSELSDDELQDLVKYILSL